MVSLFAKKSLFVLIQKVTKKIKTTRMLPRSLPVLHAFFAVRSLRFLTSPKKLNRHSRLYAGPPLLSKPTLFKTTDLSNMSLRGGTTKQPCRVQSASDEVATRLPADHNDMDERFIFSFSVSRTASGEIRQNDGGLVQWQGIADFYRRAKAKARSDSRVKI